MPPKAKVTSHPQILSVFFSRLLGDDESFPFFKQLVIFVHPAS